jgi:hypothetical protein
MITVTKYNTAEEILADKTAAELIKVWNESERKIEQLKYMPRNDKMLAEWDALIRVRGWISKAMLAKMPYDEFCKVVDIPND